MVHGPSCNATTFPTTCRLCSTPVFYYSCECGSKVFFEELGYPWPIHDCLVTNQPVDNSPSTYRPIADVSLYRGIDENHGLLPGLVHAPRELDPVAVRNLRQSHDLARDTVRMDPLGSIAVDITGVVHARVAPNLARRLGVQEGTIGYELLRKEIGSGELVQFTLVVDEIGQDPAAIDFQSYTFICKSGSVNHGIVPGTIVQVKLVQLQVLGSFPFWYSEKVELII